jgi:nucleotide-binding universal stress UspA family protein
MTETPAIYQRILAPTDGSGLSVAGGATAIRLAASQGASITFVYVVDTVVADELRDASGKTASQVQRELARAGQRYLDHLGRLATEAGLEADRVLRYGIPHVEIVDLATELDVDLVVIAHAGRHGVQRLLIGSVTERVIEYAPCSVLVVK